MTPVTTRPTAIDFPQLTVGGQSFTLRYSYAAEYQLARWGKNLGSATAIELAAAMAGHFDDEGRWRTHGFERPIDFADLMDAHDEPIVIKAATDAIKKAFPEANAPPADPGQSTANETPTNNV